MMLTWIDGPPGGKLDKPGEYDMLPTYTTV